MPNLTIPTSELARRIRVHCVKMTGRANASHIGSALSTADILAVLYGKFLRFDPKQPDWPERDRFILSKGHACTGLYAVLAEAGFLSVEDLETFYQNGSPLAGPRHAQGCTRRGDLQRIAWSRPADVHGDGPCGQTRPCRSPDLLHAE